MHRLSTLADNDSETQGINTVLPSGTTNRGCSCCSTAKFAALSYDENLQLRVYARILSL